MKKTFLFVSMLVVAVMLLTACGPAATPTAAASGVVHHKVKPGETLYSIATSYNTTVTALKHDNRDVATLRPGMILIVRDAH